MRRIVSLEARACSALLVLLAFAATCACVYATQSCGLAHGGLAPSHFALAQENHLRVTAACVSQGEAFVLDGALLSNDVVTLDMRIEGEEIDARETYVGQRTLEELMMGGNADGLPWTATELEDGATAYEGSVRLLEGTHDMGRVCAVEGADGNVVRTRPTYEGQEVHVVVVDATAPTVAVRGVAQDAQVSDPVTLEATIRDASWGYAARSDAKRVLLQLVRDDETVATLPLGWDDANDADDGHTYCIEVPARAGHEDDGSYTLLVTAVDAVGNEATPLELHFTVDTTPPVLGVSFDDADDVRASAEAGVPLFSSARTATVLLTERSLDVAQLNEEGSPVRVTVRAWDGRDPSDVAMGPWRATESGDTYACDAVFPPNGTYELRVTGTDVAGNALVGDQGTRVDEEGSYASGAFVIDDEPPIVRLAYGSGGENPRSYEGRDYFNKPVTVNVTVRDRNPVLACMSVADTHGNAVVPDWEASARDDEGYVTCTAALVYGQRGTSVKSPLVRAIDAAGNEGTGMMDPFVVDQTPPSVDRASFNKEPVSAGVGSGGAATMFFNAQDGRVPELLLEVSDACMLDTAWVEDARGVYARRFSAIEGHSSSALRIQLREPVRERLGEGADFQDDVRVFVRDIAGNIASWSMAAMGANAPLEGSTPHPQALVYDATVPHIELSGASPGAYYDAPVTILVAVEERNLGHLRRFDPQRAVATIWRQNGVTTERSAVRVVRASQLEPTKEPKSGFGEAREVLAQDGHYAVDAGFLDYANNASNVVLLREFTIDTTAPTISVSWDNTDVRNGIYYRAPRVATVVVTEHNFDESLVLFQTTGVTGPWVHLGDVHLRQVSFATDSTRQSPHSLVVRATDRAGNEAQPLQEQEFVVDTRPPTISLQKSAAAEEGHNTPDEGSELLDRTAFSGAFEPQVLLRDEECLDPATVEVRLTGRRTRDDVALKAQAERLSDGQMMLTWGDLGAIEKEGQISYDMAADDVYTLTAKVLDMAGNESEERRVTFSVNRFGSNFFVERVGVLDAKAASASECPLLLAPPLIEIHEVSASGAMFNGGEEGMDGQTHTVTKEHARVTQRIALAQGESDEGYALEESHGASPRNPYEGWTEYTYLIRPGNFGWGSDSDYGDGGQGEYRVTVSSVDRANNHNTSMTFWGSAAEREGEAVAKDASVRFVLDEQGPEVEDLVLPPAFAWAREFEATFYVHDEITEGDEVQVLVDDEPVEVRWADTADSLGEGGRIGHEGRLAFTVTAKPAFAQRSIDIRVGDYTGASERMAHVRREGFCLTTLACELGLAFALAAGTAVFWQMKRRRAQKRQPATERM